MHSSAGLIGLFGLLAAWAVCLYIGRPTIEPSPPTSDYALHAPSHQSESQRAESQPGEVRSASSNEGQEEGRSRATAAEEMVASGARAALLRAVILGAPGSGKGTISARIVKHFGVNHISSGDKLRLHIANQTGFPRTLRQAEILDELHSINLIITLVIPDSVILERLKNRWTHLPSGRTYNIGFNDPKIPGKDDETGEPLCQRQDDQPDIVRRRLNEYVTKTKPVIEFYKKRGLERRFQGMTTDELWPGIERCVQDLLFKQND